MNAVKQGLYRADDARGCEPGTPEAVVEAARLVCQAAGLSLMCSLALDSVAYGDCEPDCAADDLAAIASRVMFECWNDLTVAASFMDA